MIPANPPGPAVPSPIPRELIIDFVRHYFSRAGRYLDVTRKLGSPLYLVERQVLETRAAQFKKAFQDLFPKPSFYFAVKSNNLPEISGILLEKGYGLDVSSGVELEQALAMGAEDIIFSGPGKTEAELSLALAHSSRVVVLMDSHGEYRRLKAMAQEQRQLIRTGIRLNTSPEGLWRKFGIPPRELSTLMEDVLRNEFLKLTGLQVHSSWNLTPDRQVEYIHLLGDLLKSLPAFFLDTIEFIDIGGGYWPPLGEWLQSTNPLSPCRLPGLPIDVFADRLARAVRRHILPVVDCRICFEPGRWICNDAMHIIIQVIDKKAPDLVITDAGTNAVGWERFETDYFPVLNLSRIALVQNPCQILGSLCTPHDVWGYAYFGKDIQEGDILMIPTQGAYTYSLRQHFIKALPKVAII